MAPAAQPHAACTQVEQPTLRTGNTKQTSQMQRFVQNSKMLPDHSVHFQRCLDRPAADQAATPTFKLLLQLSLVKGGGGSQSTSLLPPSTLVLSPTCLKISGDFFFHLHCVLLDKLQQRLLLAFFHSLIILFELLQSCFLAVQGAGWVRRGAPSFREVCLTFQYANSTLPLSGSLGIN